MWLRSAKEGCQAGCSQIAVKLVAGLIPKPVAEPISVSGLRSFLNRDTVPTIFHADQVQTLGRRGRPRRTASAGLQHRLDFVAPPRTPPYVQQKAEQVANHMMQKSPAFDLVHQFGPVPPQIRTQHSA